MNKEDILIAKGKQLWSLIQELESRYDFKEIIKDNQILFDKVMLVFDSIEVAIGCNYSIDVCHEFMSGYYCTLFLDSSLFSSSLEATSDDITIGLHTKENVQLEVSSIWQIYLFCRIYKGFIAAHWNYGQPIFDMEDICIDKLEVAHADDRKLLFFSFHDLSLSHKDICPKIYKSDEDTYHLECLWWLPFKGLVRETIEYKDMHHRTYEKKVNQEVLVPYSYVDSYYKHKKEGKDVEYLKSKKESYDDLP